MTLAHSVYAQAARPEVSPQRLDDALNQLTLLSDLVSKNINNVDDFKHFIRHTIRPLLPHRQLFCGCGYIVADQIDIKYMVEVDYDPALAVKIGTHFSLSERPMVGRWLLSREPLFIHTERDWQHMSRMEQEEQLVFNLGHVAMFGQVDMHGRMATCFSFAGVDDEPAFYANRIRILMPFLHTALVRLSHHEQPPQTIQFTPKEKEVIYWLILGKQNNEIATILGKSSNTVRNQVQKIFSKLGVGNRQSALDRLQSLQLT
jgi:DNA-binding CsgD family transcriptional regulator